METGKHLKGVHYSGVHRVLLKFLCVYGTAVASQKAENQHDHLNTGLEEATSSWNTKLLS